jgi:hypothetical protein
MFTLRIRALTFTPPLARKDVMKPPGNGFFNDAYLVYELMDTDLHQVIRSSQPLSGACARCLLAQVA